jgi:hypothetical protein
MTTGFGILLTFVPPRVLRVGFWAVSVRLYNARRVRPACPLSENQSENKNCFGTRLAKAQNAETVILSPPFQAGRRISMPIVAQERFYANWT